MPTRIRLCQRMLDRYLLADDVQERDLNRLLDRFRESMPGKLALYGLADGVPDDEDEALDALIGLRLGLVEPDPHSPCLLAELRRVCLMCRLLVVFIRNDMRPSQLERGLHKINGDYRLRCQNWMTVVPELRETEDAALLRCDGLSVMTLELSLCLALVGSHPKEGDTQRIDVIDECVRTLQRLESYWLSILG